MKHESRESTLISEELSLYIPSSFLRNVSVHIPRTKITNDLAVLFVLLQMESMSMYRNPQPIPQSHSPLGSIQVKSSTSTWFKSVVSNQRP